MKIKEGFTVRKVADSYVVMKQGEETDLRRMLTLNETGAFIWELVLQGLEEEAVVNRICEEYQVDPGVALADVKVFFARMKEADVLE